MRAGCSAPGACPRALHHRAVISTTPERETGGDLTMPNTVRLHRVLAMKRAKVYRAFIEPDAMVPDMATGAAPLWQPVGRSGLTVLSNVRSQQLRCIAGGSLAGSGRRVLQPDAPLRPEGPARPSASYRPQVELVASTKPKRAIAMASQFCPYWDARTRRALRD